MQLYTHISYTVGEYVTMVKSFDPYGFSNCHLLQVNLLHLQTALEASHIKIIIIV